MPETVALPAPEVVADDKPKRGNKILGSPPPRWLDNVRPGVGCEEQSPMN
jgi:hypothetical protein